MPTTRKAGSPARAARSAVVTATTAAPSETPEEFPAVAVPSGSKAGRSRASRSIPSPARGRSSTRTPPTGRISASNIPARTAATARACDSRGVLVLGGPTDAQRVGQSVRCDAHVGVGPAVGGEGGAAVAPRLVTRRRRRPVPPWRGAGRLDPTGQHERKVAARHRARRHADRLEPGGALPVDRHPGDRPAETSGQRRHPGDVSTRSEAVAEHDVVDRKIERRHPARDVGERRRRQVRCRQPREGVPGRADRGAPGRDQHRIAGSEVAAARTHGSSAGAATGAARIGPSAGGRAQSPDGQCAVGEHRDDLAARDLAARRPREVLTDQVATGS